MIIVRKFSFIFVIFLSLLLSACWQHTKPKPKHKRKPINSQCANEPLDSANKMSNYTATYNVQDDTGVLSGSMIQSVHLKEKEFKYNSTLDVKYDLLLLYIRDVFEDDASGIYNENGFQSSHYHDHDSKSHKTTDFTVKPGYTDALTLILQVRLALLNNEKALCVKLQEGANAVKEKNLCLDLPKLATATINIPALSPSPIKTRVFVFTNAKKQILTYYLAEKYGYLPVMITTPSFEGLNVSITLTKFDFTGADDCKKK